MPSDNDEDKRVELSNLISNLQLDIDENKKIQKQLRKANAKLTQELNKSKYALTESNNIQDRCISDLHEKGSMTDINEYSEMTCKYLEKVKKCECLEIGLYKQKDTATNFHNDVDVPDAAADDNAKAMSVCDDINEADAATDENAKVTSVHDEVGVPDAVTDDNAKATSVCDDINQADAAADDNAKVVKLWVQLMWHFRPKNAERAIFSPHYCNIRTPNDLGDWIFKDITYPMGWANIETMRIQN
nr:hypothetical protein [Tanacetum cinerariifolium]